MEKAVSAEKTKSYQSWSKRISKKGMTEEIEVKEAENGFVVTHSKYGDKNGKYYHECKTYVTKENPLEEDEEKPFSEALTDILDEIAEEDGMINV